MMSMAAVPDARRTGQFRLVCSFAKVRKPMEARTESVVLLIVVAFSIFCLTLVVLVIVARTSQTMQDAIRALKDSWRMVWGEGSASSRRSRKLDATTRNVQGRTQAPSPRPRPSRRRRHHRRR